jgi:hypothetical protein
MVDIVKSKTTKIEYSALALWASGQRVSLRIMNSQHSRDEQLMLNLINYFNCGPCCGPLTGQPLRAKG